MARPDRPPGRDAPGGLALTPPGRPHNPPPSQQRASASRLALLALSDERDLWHDWVLDAWRDGWRAGFAAGDAAGSRRTAREWHVTATGLPLSVLGPSWRELELRRWGPGGRAHFGDPRPGDFRGRQHG